METKKLLDFKFPDSQPPATSSSVQVEYSGLDPSYLESKLFQTRWSKDIEESCRAVSHLCTSLTVQDAIINKGHTSVRHVYAYRSVARALPVSTDSHPNSLLQDETSVAPPDPHAYKLSCIAVLEPEIEKLRQALRVFKEATEFVSNVFNQHDFTKAEVRISDIYLRKIMKILDVLVLLDRIKSAKPSLEKDFDLYRHFLDTSKTGDSNSAENRELHLFLGPVHSIIQKFKMEMAKNARYDPSFPLLTF